MWHLVASSGIWRDLERDGKMMGSGGIYWNYWDLFGTMESIEIY